MAVYNCADYLEKSVSSILHQSYQNFELILIDDNSTDNTPNLINKFKKTDNRLRVIRNQKNQGLTKSLNLGINLAKGKYIARLDAGDIALEKRFEKQLNYIENNFNVFLVGSGVEKINEDGEAFNRYLPNYKYSQICDILPKRNVFYHSSILFRNQGMRYREMFYYAQDYDLYLRLITNNKRLELIKEPLIKYRIMQNSISFKKRFQQQQFANFARLFYVQRTLDGQDEYQSFTSTTILNKKMDPNNKTFLETQIKAKFNLYQFEDLRSLILKYFEQYEIKCRFIVYFLLSLLGKKQVLTLRRLLNL